MSPACTLCTGGRKIFLQVSFFAPPGCAGSQQEVRPHVHRGDGTQGQDVAGGGESLLSSDMK